MKLWAWLRYLSYNILALYLMSSIIERGNLDTFFLCFYNQWCNKQLFEHLHACWLILAPKTKLLIQKCAMSTCQLHLPDEFTMQNLCSNDIPYDKKKECFFECAQKFSDYLEILELRGYFTSTYEMVWHAKDCIAPYFERCRQGN